MIICAAGDIHGALDRLFEDVLAFEESLGVRFEWVLHVGDLGVWPDPHRIDKATRRPDGAGDFPTWWSERREAARRTCTAASLFRIGSGERRCRPAAE